jgi:hypothetical protein
MKYDGASYHVGNAPPEAHAGAHIGVLTQRRVTQVGASAYLALSCQRFVGPGIVCAIKPTVSRDHG